MADMNVTASPTTPINPLTPPAALPTETAEKRAFIGARLYNGIGQAADAHPYIAGALATATAVTLADKVVTPLVGKAVDGVKGMVGRKATAKIAGEAKNALIGDILSVITGNVGELIS